MGLRTPHGDGHIDEAVHELIARSEISQLVHRYALALDRRDGDAAANLYTVDGEFERVQGSVKGRGELRKAYAAMLVRFEVMRHMPAAHEVRLLDADTAEGTQTGTAELVENRILLVAAYRWADRYARQGGHWQFKRRSLRYLYVTPVDELPTVFRTEERIRWPGKEPTPGHFG